MNELREIFGAATGLFVSQLSESMIKPTDLALLLCSTTLKPISLASKSKFVKGVQIAVSSYCVPSDSVNLKPFQ